jgi:hypothetical protein
MHLLVYCGYMQRACDTASPIANAHTFGASSLSRCSSRSLLRPPTEPARMLKRRPRSFLSTTVISSSSSSATLLPTSTAILPATSISCVAVSPSPAPAVVMTRSLMPVPVIVVGDTLNQTASLPTTMTVIVSAVVAAITAPNMDRAVSDVKFRLFIPRRAGH